MTTAPADPTPETGVGAGVADETQDAAADVAASLRVLGGNPTTTELAAITAVLAGIAEELGDRLQRRPETRSTAWAAVQRPIRSRILPGVTRWRGFSG